MKLKKAFVAAFAATALMGGATGAYAQDETLNLDQQEEISCNTFDVINIHLRSPEIEDTDCSDEYTEETEVTETTETSEETNNVHAVKKHH